MEFNARRCGSRKCTKPGKDAEMTSQLLVVLVVCLIEQAPNKSLNLKKPVRLSILTNFIEEEDGAQGEGESEQEQGE